MCIEYCSGFPLMLTKRDVQQIRIPKIFRNINLFDPFEKNILQAAPIIFWKSYFKWNHAALLNKICYSNLRYEYCKAL